MREVLENEYQSLLEVRQQASSLTVFRSVLADEISQTLLSLVGELTSGTAASASISSDYGRLFALLAEDAELYRGEAVGNAWQNHLLDRLLDDENAFSRKAELSTWEEMGSSLVEAARLDLRILQSLFQLDTSSIAQAAQQATHDSPLRAEWPGWDAFKGMDARAEPRRSKKTELKCRLGPSADWSELTEDLAGYFRETGVGIFGRYRAFRWVRQNAKGQLQGIASPDPIRLHELIGYELERDLLIRNTEYFLAGYPANNVLLYGDRGTGKSSTVKALLNEYGDRGLRLVEVPKQHLDDFPQMLSCLRGRRERFILFVDDLSFEDDETHYKELKAVLEGNVEARPENVLLYATSNRRHLIRERFADRQEEMEQGIHPGDTFEEKLSLSDRFGITLTFLSPDQDRYLAVVRELAKQRGLEIPQDELQYRALQWATQHNGRSGRTARQFVDFLTGELGTRSRGNYISPPTPKSRPRGG